MKRRYVVEVGAQVLYRTADMREAAEGRVREVLSHTPNLIPGSIHLEQPVRDAVLRGWEINGYAKREIGWAQYRWQNARWSAKPTWWMFWWNHPMPFGPLGRERRAFKKELEREA